MDIKKLKRAMDINTKNVFLFQLGVEKIQIINKESNFILEEIIKKKKL